MYFEHSCPSPNSSHNYSLCPHILSYPTLRFTLLLLLLLLPLSSFFLFFRTYPPFSLLFGPDSPLCMIAMFGLWFNSAPWSYEEPSRLVCFLQVGLVKTCLAALLSACTLAMARPAPAPAWVGTKGCP